MSATAANAIYGQTIWDPTDGLARFKNPVLLIVAMLALYIATLATNIAANVVAAVLPSLPGFFVTIKAIAPGSVPDPLIELYNYAWFIGFALASVIYLVLRKIAPKS